MEASHGYASNEYHISFFQEEIKKNLSSAMAMCNDDELKCLNPETLASSLYLTVLMLSRQIIFS